MTTISLLLERLRQFRDDRNWSQFHTPKDLAISISVEAAELLEIFQWLPQADEITQELKANVGEEAADVLLYLLLLCDRLEIDILAEANQKLGKNEQRFPIEKSRNIAKPKDQMSRK